MHSPLHSQRTALHPPSGHTRGNSVSVARLSVGPHAGPRRRGLRQYLPPLHFRGVAAGAAPLGPVPHARRELIHTRPVISCRFSGAGPGPALQLVAATGSKLGKVSPEVN